MVLIDYVWSRINLKFRLVRWYLKVREKFSLKRYNCPICDYGISKCQCLYSGSGHPDKYKRREVVLDHLYLFSKPQIRHLRALEYYENISYRDREKTELLEQLNRKYGKVNQK